MATYRPPLLLASLSMIREGKKDLIANEHLKIHINVGHCDANREFWTILVVCPDKSTIMSNKFKTIYFFPSNARSGKKNVAAGKTKIYDVCHVFSVRKKNISLWLSKHTYAFHIMPIMYPNTIISRMRGELTQTCLLHKNCLQKHVRTWRMR